MLIVSEIMNDQLSMYIVQHMYVPLFYVPLCISDDKATCLPHPCHPSSWTALQATYHTPSVLRHVVVTQTAQQIQATQWVTSLFDLDFR